MISSGVRTCIASLQQFSEDIYIDTSMNINHVQVKTILYNISNNRILFERNDFTRKKNQL